MGRIIFFGGFWATILLTLGGLGMGLASVGSGFRFSQFWDI